MACFSLGNIVILCVLLPHAVMSFQGCPQGGVYPDSVEEGPRSKGHELAVYGGSIMTNLTVKDDALGYLAINVSHDGDGETTFTLYIAKEIDLETLQRDSLEGSVVCSDHFVPTGYSPSDVLITITAVNEFPPLFRGSPYFKTVMEDSPLGFTVFLLSGRAEDVDYPPATLIVYGIENNHSPFTIDYGQAVFLNRYVDYETGPRTYILNISAQELGTTSPLTSYTTLTIDVRDADDLGPRFTNNATYTLALPEGEYHGGTFNTDPVLSAKDGDSLNEVVQLELDNTSVALADRLTVLPNGSLQVRGMFYPGHFTVNIRAYQTNRPSDRFAVTSVSVTVYDINDHSPVMSSGTYFGQVQEAVVPGVMVLTVSASDGDQGVNSSFQFHLSDPNVPFSISTEGSVGILHVSGNLDRERQQSIILHVYAQEDKTPERLRSDVSVVTVTLLDVNDNSPVFHRQHYVFYVKTTDLEATIVGQVKAADADSGSNGEVIYTMSSADPISFVDAFSMDPRTGVIMLKRNLTLQDAGVVFLDVRADDNAPASSRRSQSTRVRVTIVADSHHVTDTTTASNTFTAQDTVQEGVSHDTARPVPPQPGTGNPQGAVNVKSSSGNPPKKTLHCCRVTSVVFSGGCGAGVSEPEAVTASVQRQPP